MILSQVQAKAVYSAMCALNSVSGRVNCIFGLTCVIERDDGNVSVMQAFEPGNWVTMEQYENQAAFADDYGLQ